MYKYKQMFISWVNACQCSMLSYNFILIAARYFSDRRDTFFKKKKINLYITLFEAQTRKIWFEL